MMKVEVTAKVIKTISDDAARNIITHAISLCEDAKVLEVYELRCAVDDLTDHLIEYGLIQRRE